MEPIAEFEQLVLLAVARLGPQSYGMAVRDEIGDRTGKSVSLAAVYATLRRLEAARLVSSWTSPPAAHRGGRATKHFVLQRRGALALQRAQRAMQRMWEGLELSPYLEGR